MQTCSDGWRSISRYDSSSGQQQQQEAAAAAAGSRCTVLASLKLTGGLSPHLLSCRLRWVFITVVSGNFIFQTLIGITSTNRRCSTRQVLISTTGIPNHAGAFQGSSLHVWLRFIPERMQTKSNRLRDTLKSPRVVKAECLVDHQVSSTSVRPEETVVSVCTCKKSISHTFSRRQRKLPQFKQGFFLCQRSFLC